MTKAETAATENCLLLACPGEGVHPVKGLEVQPDDTYSDLTGLLCEPCYQRIMHRTVD